MKYPIEHSNNNDSGMKFYRYEIKQYSNYGYDIDGDYVPSSLPPTTKLELEEYNLIKETEKGYWIGYTWFKKWVSKTSKKRFAYPTKEEALTNFIKRTERRINYLENDLDACKIGLELAKAKTPA